MFICVSHHQMDELTPTDKLSPLALVIMSQIGSTATTGFKSLLTYVYTYAYFGILKCSHMHAREANDLRIIS